MDLEMRLNIDSCARLPDDGQRLGLKVMKAGWLPVVPACNQIASYFGYYYTKMLLY